MKKVLFVTTALVLTAGAAAAETGVKIGGYGRFGLYNNSKPGTDPVTGASLKKSGTHYRMRVNIDATTDTDSGVTFGGRLRLQSSYNNTGGTLSNAILYGVYQGIRVEVGNANTAYDSVALMYDSELGFEDTSFGDPQGNYYSYNSTPYSASERNRVGVFGSYSVGNFNGRISYIQPDQYHKHNAAGVKDESSISLDYVWNQFTVAAAFVNNGGGVDGNQEWFIGGAYAINDVAKVGLNYIDNDDWGNTATVYGNYTMGATTLKGYIASTWSQNRSNANVTPVRQNTAVGIGADYDLGGARLSGGFERGYQKENVFNVGVRFDF